MDIKLIKNEICIALANEIYSRELREICSTDAETTTFLNLLDDILDRQFLHSPKDIPYAKPNYKKNEIYNNDLTVVASWNIYELHRAKIHDYLWIKSNQIESARKALVLYIYHIKSAQKSHETFAALYRVIDLNRRININNAIAVDIPQLWKCIYSQSIPSERLTLLKLAFDYQFINIDEIADLAEDELSSLTNQETEVEVIKAFVDLFDKALQKKKENKGAEKERLNRILRIAVDTLIVASRSANATPVYRSHLLEQAIQRLKRIGGTEEERKQLHLERSEIQKSMLSQMHIHHHEIDMSEIIAKFYRVMESLNKDECLNLLARILPLFDPVKISEAIASRGSHGLTMFFGVNIMDAAGKTSATIPSLLADKKEEAMEAHAIHDTLLSMDINGFFIAHILEYIRTHFDVNLEDVSRLVENSAFVTPGRNRQFEIGINAGFQKDFITAINVLVPQVENAFRCLLQECGIVVYNLKDDGTEELKTFSALLELPETAEFLENDLLFTLKAVFCSKYGLNLRNEVAHGLLSDSFYFSHRAYYVWWLIFKLCYILNGREYIRHSEGVTKLLEELSEEQNELNTDNTVDENIP